MSAQHLPRTLIIALTAIAGYFIAPAINLDGLSLGLGLILGALLGALLPAPAKREKNRPVPASAAGTDPSDQQTIFVGNLAFRASRQALIDLFAAHGQVLDARIVTDKKTRKPRGYGFVEMPRADAEKAIAALNGTEFYGRTLNVSPANEQRRPAANNRHA